MRYLNVRPEVETGYPLAEDRSFFSVVVPCASVNIVQNPEPADLDRYSTLGAATIEHVTTQQRRGIGSIEVTPSAANGGVAYSFPEALPAGKHFTFSVDVRGPGLMAIFFGTVAGVMVGQAVIFNSPKFWDRRFVTIITPDTSVRTVCVISLDGAVFHAGGFQCENLPYATTFISGNLVAPLDTLPSGQMGYAWAGPAHRAMSYRSADATNGGRSIPFSDLGFEITNFMGLGFQVQELLTSRFAFRDHAGYIGSNLADRQFTLGGILHGDGLQSLLEQRGALGTAAVGPERTPLLIQIQLFADGEPSSEVAEIEAIYISGLEGNIANLYEERVALNFQSWRPALVVEGNRSMRLDVDLGETEEHIAVLYPDGLMDTIAPPMTTDEPPEIRYASSNMVIGSDGCLYMGFSLDLMRWDGASWLAVYTLDPNADPVGTPDSSVLEIRQLCIGPDGRIYLYYRYVCATSGVDTYLDGIQAYNIASATIDKLANTMVIPYDGTVYGRLIWGMKDISAAKPGYIGVCGRHFFIQNDNMFYDPPGAIQPIAGFVGYYSTLTLKWEPCEYHFSGTFPGVVYPEGTATVRDFVFDGNKRLWIGGEFWTGTDIETDIFHLAVGENSSGIPYWQRYGCLSQTASGLGNVRDDVSVQALYYDTETDFVYVGGTFDRYHIYPPGGGALNFVLLSIGIARARWFWRPLFDDVSAGVVGSDSDPRPRVKFVGRQPGGGIYLAGEFIAGWSGSSRGDPTAKLVDAGGVILYDPAADRFTRSPISSYRSDLGTYYWVDDIVFSVQQNLWMSGYSSTPAIKYGQFDPLLSSFTARPGTTGAVYVYSANAGWRTSGATTVAVRTGATAWPRFEIHGPCKMHSIINATARRRIVVDREVGAGEIVIIDTLPGHSVVYSSASGVVPPSEAGDNSFPDFPLLAGDNRIMVVMDSYTTAAACYMTWREEFSSFDGLVRYAR